MRRLARFKLLFILMVLGAAFAIAGCDNGDDGGGGGGGGGGDDGIVDPLTVNILLDRTVSLNANTFCSGSFNFCVEASFIPLQIAKEITVSVTGPSNLDPDVLVLNSLGGYVADGLSYNPGSEILTFMPDQIDTYRVIIYDANMVGGSVRIYVTQ